MHNHEQILNEENSNRSPTEKVQNLQKIEHLDGLTQANQNLPQPNTIEDNWSEQSESICNFEDKDQFQASFIKSATLLPRSEEHVNQVQADKQDQYNNSASGQSHNSEYIDNKLSIYQIKKLQEVSQQFDYLSKEDKQKESFKLIKNLQQKDEDYFRGRQLKFVNGFCYRQCIDLHDDKDQVFITVQHIDRSLIGKRQGTKYAKPINQELEEFSYYELVKESADSNQSEATQTYVDQEEVKRVEESNKAFKFCRRKNEPDIQLNEWRDPHSDNLQQNEDYVSLALWLKSKHDIGEQLLGFQCKKPLYYRNVLSKEVNSQMKIQKTLFKGVANQAFFFNEENEVIVLNIINKKVLLHPKQEDLRQYNILKGSDLHTQLGKQLNKKYMQSFEQKKENQNSANEIDEKDSVNKQMNRIALPVPDPTIDKIDGKQYLILTEYYSEESKDKEETKTKVCFYELSSDNSKRGELSKSPQHICESTLMYIGTSQDKSILVLSDDILTINVTKNNLVKDKIKNSIKAVNLKIGQQYINSNNTYLQGNFKAPTFAGNSNFAKNPSVYPFIEALFHQNQKEKGIAIRFFGSDREAGWAIVIAKDMSKDSKEESNGGSRKQINADTYHIKVEENALCLLKQDEIVAKDQDYGIFVLSGSLRYISKLMKRHADETEIALNLINISNSIPPQLIAARSILDGLQDVWKDDFNSEDTIIQAMTVKVNKSKKEKQQEINYKIVVTMSSMSFNFEQNGPEMKFFTQQAIIAEGQNDQQDGERSEHQINQVQKPTSQSIMTSYPIIAYKGFSPDNNQIFIANVARKEDRQKIFSLGDWRFIAFIGYGTPRPEVDFEDKHLNTASRLSKIIKYKNLDADKDESQKMEVDDDDSSSVEEQMTKVNLSSYIHILANKVNQPKEVKIIEIEIIDPWQADFIKQLNVQIWPRNRSLQIPDKLIVCEAIKKAECLMQNDNQNKCLLLQSETEMWSLSLQNRNIGHEKDIMYSNVFDASDTKMLPKFMIRESKSGHYVYCAISSSNGNRIVKIQLKPGDHSGKPEVQEFFNLEQNLIYGLELDTEREADLIVIDDLLNVIQLSEAKDGRGRVKKTQANANYPFDDYLIEYLTRPWSNVSVSERAIQIGDYCLSSQTNFFWKSQDVKPNITYQKNMKEAKFLLQACLKFMYCKPLPGSKYFDLVGQERSSNKTKMHFVSNDNILVNFENLQSDNDDQVTYHSLWLLFNKDGYLIDQKSQRDVKMKVNQQLQVYTESRFKQIENSKEFVKFLLLRTKNKEDKPKQTDQYELVQFNEAGQQQVLIEKEQFTKLYDKLKQDMSKSDGQGQVKFQYSKSCYITFIFQILRFKKQGTLRTLQKSESMTRMIQKEFTHVDKFKIHYKHSLVTKQGNVVLIATMIMDDKENKESQFNNFEEMLQATSYDQNQQKYMLEKSHPIGFSSSTSNVNQNKIFVITFWCTRIQRYQQFESHPQNTDQVSKTLKFTVVRGIRLMSYSKLVCYNEDPSGQNAVIWHIDIDENKEYQQTIQWINTPCKIFSVANFRAGMNQDKIGKNDIHISEIAEFSVLRTKKVPELHDYHMCLLQIMAQDHCQIVYNLEDKQYHEVAQLDKNEDFKNPMSYSMTGFEYITSKKAMIVNYDRSLGFVSPCNQAGRSGLERSYCEIDLNSIQQTSQQIQQFGTLKKNEIQKIELETVTTEFEGQTFFSLFEEQEALYEKVHDMIKSLDYEGDAEISSNLKKKQNEYLIRRLAFIVEKPTPLRVKYNDCGAIKILTHMSILKSCPLFIDALGAKTLYKLAKILPQISFESYLKSQQDLEIIISRLPAQFYRTIFNTFGQNHFTKQIDKATLETQGRNKTPIKLKIIKKTGQVITNPELNDPHFTDDQVQKKVIIKLLPLRWIYNISDLNGKLLTDRNQNSLTEIFKFFNKNQEKLREVQLLHFMFEAFWIKQQIQIGLICFLPFLLYYINGLVYYLVIMQDDIYQNIELNKNWERPTRFIFFLLILIQLFVEIVQIKAHRKSELTAYLKLKAYLTYYNIVDWVSLLLNIVIVILISLRREFQMDIEGLNMYWIRILSSLSCVLMGIQMFNWLRLKRSLAKEVELIAYAIISTLNFIIVIGFCLLTSTAAFYMLQVNRIEADFGDTSHALFEYEKGKGRSPFQEALFIHYKMLLGDFGDFQFNRDHNDEPVESLKLAIKVENMMILIYFVFSSALILIVFMNMLIAIMSDTQIQFAAEEEELGYRVMFSLIADYLPVVDQFFKIFKCFERKNESDKYLFIIEPTENTGEDDEEGDDAREFAQHRKLMKGIDARFKALENKISKQTILADIKSIASESQINQSSFEKDTRIRINKMQNSLTTLDAEGKQDRDQKKEAIDEQLKKNLSSLEQNLKKEFEAKLDQQEANLRQELKSMIKMLKPIQEKAIRDNKRFGH